MADQISQRFSHDELRSATRNFNEALIIGCGGFGKVYKGYLLNGSNPCVVAIKQLNSISNQGFKEFRAEIEMLSQIRHCNLVSLIGYCDEGQEEMALVYEYMRHGTLSEHLHKTSFPLSWLQRLKICIGVGRGLDYLHTGTGTRQGIIHRDVKSSNILLDENFEARISDFGLAKIGPANQLRMHVTTGVKGTFGYMDPCYFYTGELTRKSDVYAFGVVMLEMMCGRPAVDSSLKEDQWSLASWAQGYIEKGKVNDILDYRIRAQVSNSNTCVKDFAHIAHRCLHGEPNKRPTMAEIVPKIELILSLQERLDSSLTKVNFIDKVLSCFSANVEAKSNLITAGESVDERNVTSSQCTNGNLRSFSFDVLKAATRNFRWGTVLGESGSDSVFKGWIHEPSLTYAKPGAGTPVAVKRFDIDTRYKETEWLAEIDYLGKKLSHPNITSLIGYCLEDEQRILVYEFMHRGSLENHLFRRGPYMNILPWDRRIKIMLGAAKGLAYLHSTEANVIYCSFNSSSILMDCNDNAKLYKFGLAKDGPVDGKSYVTTEVTPSSSNGCYTAPEYIALGNLTTKCDIYSFGVVLLEIMTGRRCLDENRAPGERILTEFVKPYLKSKKKILRIMDRCLDGQYNITSAMDVARLAMNCLLDESMHRPTADEVVHALEMVRFNITSNST